MSSRSSHESDREEDSSDDDMEVSGSEMSVNVDDLPSIVKDDQAVAAKLKKARQSKTSQTGTVYLGRIPHGFYEDEMKGYFAQFGEVTRVRLARSRKTGAPKHYAFLEFKNASVAEIVADTMNNYLLMGHLLKCHVMPQDEIHSEMWAGSNKKFRVIPRARLEKARVDKSRTEEQKMNSDQKLLRKQEERRRKIQEMGIDYEFEGHKGSEALSTKI